MSRNWNHSNITRAHLATSLRDTPPALGRPGRGWKGQRGLDLCSRLRESGSISLPQPRKPAKDRVPRRTKPRPWEQSLGNMLPTLAPHPGWRWQDGEDPRHRLVAGQAGAAQIQHRGPDSAPTVLPLEPAAGKSRSRRAPRALAKRRRPGSYAAWRLQPWRGLLPSALAGPNRTLRAVALRARAPPSLSLGPPTFSSQLLWPPLPGTVGK